MLNFCTLFNINYLSRGLAMYESLKKHCCDFHLYIFPFDDKCLNVLQKMNLEHVTLISMSEFEDSELLRVKPSRTPVEYCWTCTSSTILYVIEKYAVKNCTYVDADIYFFGPPEELISEMGRTNKSVLITRHRYAPEHDRVETSGIYCVQFMTFKNNGLGMKVLRWWREACLEWCYAYCEDGKLGDQKYLDDWPSRFEGICDIEHLGGGVAPWNASLYDIFEKNKKVVGRDISTGKEFNVIFYHFQGLKFFRDGSLQFTGSEYKLSKYLRELVYWPYIKHIELMKRAVLKIDGSSDPHGPQEPSERRGPAVWETIKNIYRRKYYGNYNIYYDIEFKGLMRLTTWHI